MGDSGPTCEPGLAATKVAKCLAKSAVYAKGTGTRLFAGLCGGTHELSGEPHLAPLVGSLLVATLEEDGLGVIGLAALVGVIGSGIWASRRRRA
jgi:hypothetical protein